MNLTQKEGKETQKHEKRINFNQNDWISTKGGDTLLELNSPF